MNAKPAANREDAMPALRTTCPPTRRRPRVLTAFVLTLMTACALPITRNAEPGRDAAGNEGAVTAGHPWRPKQGWRCCSRAASQWTRPSPLPQYFRWRGRT